MLSDVNTLTSMASNDCFEQGITAINKTLEVFKVIQGFSVPLQHHLFLITDTSPEDNAYVNTVIDEAKALNTSVHVYFRSSNCSSQNLTAYKQIFYSTNGLGVKTIEDFYAILKFVRSFTLGSQDKIEFSSRDVCASIQITNSTKSLTILISTTQENINLTQPDRASVQVFSTSGKYTGIQFSNPAEGEWKVCAISGQLEVAFTTSFQYDSLTGILNQ